MTALVGAFCNGEGEMWLRKTLHFGEFARVSCCQRYDTALRHWGLHCSCSVMASAASSAAISACLA